jgi:hypothetical protein
MAAKLGVPYDEQRLYSDHAYTESLGKRYLQDQLDKYGGNRVLAAAAYNAGPERVDEWIAKFGDPRTGAISDTQFAAQIPFNETRNYVRAVGAIDSAVVQGQGGATRNLPIAPTLNAQLDKAATTDGNLKVEVFSGGQPSTGANRVGSHRHDEGDAADVQLRDTRTGQLLDMRKPEDQARMRGFITAAVAAGATGVGAAEGYMGPHGIHIGGGKPAVWGADETSATAPGWVKGAFDDGRKQVGTLTPPAVPAAPAAAVPAAPAVTNALVPGQTVLGNTPLDTVPGGAKSIQSAAPIAITSGTHKGKYLLLPGVKADGSPATEDEALDQYEKDGKHLGIFNSPGDAAGTAPAAAPAATSQQQRQYNEAFKEWQAANPGADPKIFTDYRARQGFYVPPAAAPPAGAAPAPAAAAPAARLAGAQTFDTVGGDSIARSGAVNGDLPGSHAVSATEPVLTGSKDRKPVPGRKPGDAAAVGGRDPTGNLDYVNAHPDEFQGKKIFWSTGLMNAGETAEEARTALPKVREQLDTLVNKLHAQVVLVGVDKGKFAPLNKELDALASEYKIPFAGALPTNNVHPGAAAMKEYVRKAGQLLPPSSGDTGPTPAPLTAGTDENVPAAGTEGGDYGGGGEPAETPAVPGTEPAAVSGGSREVRSPELITPSAATPAPAAAGGTGTSITKMPPGGWTPRVDITAIETAVDANAAAGRHSAEEAAKIKAGLIAEQHRRDALVKPQRDELANTLTGGLAMLKDGRPFDYSEDEIRHFYPKADADKIIGGLNDARDMGKITAQVRGAADPDQIEAMRADLQGKLDTGDARGFDKREALFNHFQTVAKTRKAELDKSMVETEINRYFGAGPGLAAISAPGFGQEPARDPNDLVQRVQADIDYGRLRPDVGAEIQRGLVQRVNVLNAAEHNDQVAFQKQLTDGAVALASGQDFDYASLVPRIRHYWPSDKADEIVQGLADAKTEGGFRAEISNSTPQQIADRQAQLEQSMKDDPQATNFTGRAKLLHQYIQVAKDQKEALDKDPGAYVRQNSPIIKQKYADYLATLNGPPAAQGPAFADYAQATLAQQGRLGVPPEQQHVLPKAEAQSHAMDIARDPEKSPQQMQRMAAAAGDAWPQVWNDLITQGKLPAGYQVVGQLADYDPGNASVLARSLGAKTKDDKGFEALVSAKAPGGKSIRQVADETIPVDERVVAYERSLLDSGASVGQTVAVRAAIEHLAAGRAIFLHEAPTEATEKAIDAVIGHYQFMPNGGGRVPADRFSDVSANAQSTLNDLSLDRVAVPARFGSAPSEPKPQEYIDNVKAAPTWVTGPKADRLFLLDPAGRVVKDKDGAAISVPFSQQRMMPPPAAIPPATAMPF